MSDTSVANPASPGADEEVVLRLGDLLRRIPAQTLKPGPHDPSRRVRFSVDELARQIARGRVSVPLSRLASVCPDVFEAPDDFAGREEIPLPLQKLLDQIGLANRNPLAANGMPQAQAEQARAEASRTLEPVGARAEIPSTPSQPPVEEAAPPAGIAKAFTAAKQLFGFFGRQNDSPAEPPQPAPPSGEKTAAELSPPAPPQPPEPANSPAAVPEPPQNTASEPVPEPASQLAVEPPRDAVPAAAAPEGFISLRLLPIFRLLPDEATRENFLPPAEARALLPLALIDPHLASGHVEVPLEALAKGMPETLRGCLHPAPGMQAWIPLDEIFLNLPAAHPYYMPPLETAEANTPEEPAPTGDGNDEPAAESAQAPASAPAPALEDHGDEPAKAEKEILPSPEAEIPLEPEQAEPKSSAPDEPAAEQPAEVPEAQAPSAIAPEIPPPTPLAAPPEEPLPGEEPAPAESAPDNAASTLPNGDIEPEPASNPAPEAESKPQPSAAEGPEETPAAHAPWMRGFRVPPPRLFSGDPGVPQTTDEPSVAPPVSKTPEAKQTADFLASQPGIFAAAAFVEGAIFASTDFPRKPDLDTLRDVIGAFVHDARESARRLGWNGLLTLACEQYFVTAIVHDGHFLAALHHDRVLPPGAHEALLSAAEELAAR